MHWEDLTPPEYRAADRRAHRDALAHGNAGPYEKALYRAGGGEVPVQVHLVLLDAASQTVLCIAHDLSRSRKMEDELRLRAEGLAAEGRKKDEFLAMLGHELRNPLAPIRNAADLIGGEGVGRAQRDRLRRLICDQVGVLSRLVDDLLDAARIQQGKVQLRPEPCDLKAVVEAAVEASRAELEARRHQVFIATPEEPLWAECDARRINQVLSNLLSNAGKYTEPGGRVWVSLERDGKAGDACGTACAIRVRDNGRGISPDFLPHVWDLFSQEPATMDRPTGGLGIGLTLVRRIVEMHGGTVEARSQGRGQGSEFVLRLPCRPMGWRGRPPTMPAMTAFPARSLRALVVDDNFAAAETTAIMLRQEGHAVSVVHDGPAALATDANFKPDVVLLDIGLPEMDGYEVARRLREQDPTAVLVAVTGYGGAAEQKRGMEAGFHHYLVKPVEPATIRRILADIARATQPPPPAPQPPAPDVEDGLLQPALRVRSGDDMHVSLGVVARPQGASQGVIAIRVHDGGDGVVDAPDKIGRGVGREIGVERGEAQGFVDGVVPVEVERPVEFAPGDGGVPVHLQH
jgi:signal transduction histidine kinase/CheY-like chemotaxis protein